MFLKSRQPTLRPILSASRVTNNHVVLGKLKACFLGSDGRLVLFSLPSDPFVSYCLIQRVVIHGWSCT
jgi:hypothetical protein